VIGIKSLERIEYVCENDPALDKGAEGFDWAKYIESGDHAHIRFRDGCTPSVFSLRRLSRKQYLRTVGRPQMEMISEAVAWGLAGVKGLGSKADLRFEKTDAGERLSDASLDAVFAPELFAELSLRILSLSGVHPF
jgi:hypothetical protein